MLPIAMDISGCCVCKPFPCKLWLIKLYFSMAVLMYAKVAALLAFAEKHSSYRWRPKILLHGDGSIGPVVGMLQALSTWYEAAWLQLFGSCCVDLSNQAHLTVPVCRTLLVVLKPPA